MHGAKEKANETEAGDGGFRKFSNAKGSFSLTIPKQ